MSTFTLTLDNGVERECNYLFKFEDEDNNKKYIFFEIVGSNEVDVMGYIEDEEGLQLIPITDDKERDMLGEILAEYESQGCNCDGGCGDSCGCENSCGCNE